MTEPHAAVRATSRAAARSLTDSALSHMRLRVYGFVRDRAQGATCDETEAALGLRHQTASAQRANLSRFSNVLQRCRLVPYCNKQLDIMLCRPGLRELFLAGWLFTTGRNPPDP
jgi:hypothetical protein